VSDYEGLIRIGIEGLANINKLNTALEKTTRLYDQIENVHVNIGQIAESSERNLQRTNRDLGQALLSMRGAARAKGGAAQARDSAGRYTKGGGTMEERRLAHRLYADAKERAIAASKTLKEERENRRKIAAAEDRYARALDRVTDIQDSKISRLAEQTARNERVMRGIGEGSRGNYLTNLFQSRQREFARGGGGAGLSPELQQQARNARSAWDLATAGGRENLQLMQRLATEMAGLLHQQNALNRGGAGRSIGFEAGRRGRERISALSEMPEADAGKIRRLRSLTTGVISAAYRGDIAGSREAARKMNVSINRYKRELDATAQELKQQRQSQFKDFNLRQNWATISEEARQMAQGPRALPSSAMLAERVARTPAGTAPVRLDDMQKRQQKRDREAAQKLEKAIRMGGPSSPIGGKKFIEDSPAYLKAQDLRYRRQQEQAVRKGRLDARSVTEFARQQAAVAKREDQLSAFAGKGLDVSAQQAQIAEARTKIGDKSVAAREEFKRSIIEIDTGIRGLADSASKAAKALSASAIAETGNTRNVSQQSKIAQREDRLLKLAQQGANVSSAQIQLDKAKARAGQESVKAQEGFKRSILRLDTEIRRLSASAAKSADKQLFRGNVRSAIGEGLIGGAFPLLFGQGVGASVGGLAGGFAGGMIGDSFGFGLSLVGTAVGQAVDNTAKNLTTLAAALKSPSDAMAALEASGFRVSDSLKFQVEQLRLTGRAYDAQTLVLQEAQRRLGPGSLTELNRLDTAQKRLQEQWSAIAAEIQIRLLPVLQELVGAVSGAAGNVGGFASQSRLQRLDPKKFEQLRSQANREASAFDFNVFGIQLGFGGDRKKYETRLSELSKQELSKRFANERAQIPQTPQEKIADIDASIAMNEANKARTREYLSLAREAEDLRIDNEGKIFQMRRQSSDIEKEKLRLRLDIENKIFDMRQSTAKLEIDNARSRASVAIESLDAELARRLDVSKKQGGEFVDQLREYLRARGQGESELQAKERENKLQIAANERELQGYILQVSEKTASINRIVEDYKRDQAKFGFESSRRLEDHRVKTEEYIYGLVKDRYQYAIGSEQEILRIKIQAAASLGATMPPGVDQLPTGIGASGLANPLGPQRTGRPPWWNDGLGAGRGHKGQDLGVDPGTTVHAIEDAVVAGIIKGFGKAGDAVVLRYKNSDKAGVYGHINPMPGLRKGQEVKAGQQIGIITPDKGNEHLHYEFRKLRGRATEVLDPAKRLRAAMSGGVLATPRPSKLPPAGSAIPFSQKVNAPSSVIPLKVEPFNGKLPTYGAAPMAVPAAPVAQSLPTPPAAMVLPDTTSLRAELKKQSKELNEELGIAKKLFEIEKGRILLRLTSSKAVRDRLDEATQELSLSLEIFNANKASSQDDRARTEEKIKTLNAIREINSLEEQALSLSSEMLQKKKIENEEHLQIVGGIKERTSYEKQLLAIADARAELARREAFSQRYAEMQSAISATGTGIRSGKVGASARAYETELSDSGNLGQAELMAKSAAKLEQQRAVWENLERNIVDTSNAISGGLTNGLLDIVSGSRKIADVGREVLDSVARSFADSAQQQLSLILQRQLGGLLGSGAGTAGPQALGAASVSASTSVWSLNNAALAASAALQTIAAQAAFSQALGGSGLAGGATRGLAGDIGSAAFAFAGQETANGFLKAATSGVSFGGFMANGGVTQPNEVYAVGEKEPEFFFPGTVGRVVPQSDIEKAASLRESDRRNETLDIRYTVEERAGERYVTERQLREAVAASQGRTQAMTYAGMRNNSDIRGYVGI
jgi:murein DD-endopeptidase MepM/ murein hydrolase activator NlpD